MSSSLPQSFGRYTLLERIGEGGMAEVYLAEAVVAEGLRKRVVVKKIRAEVAGRPEFLRMFIAEAEIALGLNHANIVQVFDFGQARGAFYLAMELVEGVDLMRLTYLVRDAEARIPVVIAAYIAHQAAAALAYAHQKRDDFGRPLGIVHRDISPHNIMISFAGTVKLLDFGIARTAARADGPDEATIQGKIAYMSPEQAMGRPVDARSDVYSLGVVLHELLTGQLVFRDRSRTAALAAVRRDPLPPVQSVVPDLPDELAQITSRALAREPDARWDSARALQAALAAFLHRADPVVDDEVLSAFVARHAAPGAPQVHRELEVTREIEGSGPPLAPLPAEIRRVVLLKVALAPAHADETPADPARFLALARDIAYKRDAQVIELGPRGLLLLFGALVDAGDVDESALRAALALRDAAGEAAPGFAVGAVLAGAPLPIRRDAEGSPEVEVGHDLRRHLQALAASALEGPVLIAGDLAPRLAPLWRIGPAIAPVGELGAADLPPWASRLVDARPLLGPVEVPRPAGGRLAFVGRELELKVLRDSFAEAIRARRARAVLVVGAPGLGKRTLVDRFLASLPRGACTVLRGRGQWRRRNVSLGLFLGVLREHFDVGPDTPPAAIAARLAEARVDDPGELARGLAEAIGAPASPTAERTVIDPEARRDRLWRLVRRLVRALAQTRPVLVVLEELGLADEHSLRLLHEWLARPPELPLCVVVTTRPGARADELAAAAAVQVVALGELDPHARRELILRRFEDPAAAGELAEAILARTGGSPLFIEETLADLLRRGVVGPGAERSWRVYQPGARIEVPPSVEDALRRRIDALTPDLRAAAAAAAVLGLTFRTAEVAPLLGRSGADVEAALLALEGDGLVERTATPGPAARFTTVSLHEVLRTSLSPATLEALHARAAALKAARADYRPGRDDGPIADHWIQAGDRAAAIAPALRAAADARDVAGNVEAHYYLSLALRAMDPGDPRAWDALLGREAILAAWGRRRAQGSDLRALLGLAVGDPAREVAALARLVRFYLDCGRIQPAERLYPRLARQTDALAEPGPWRGELGELGSALMLARGQADAAERLAAEGLRHCPADAWAQRCRLQAALGRAQLADGRLAPAAASFEAALHLAQRTGMTRIQGEALNSLGEAAGRAGRYQEAVDHFRAALQIDRDLGDRAATGIKLANLGIVYTAIGVYRRAERFLRKALELHEAIGHRGLLGEVVVNLGEVSAELGDVAAARALLLQAAELAQTRQDHRTELRARARLARALLDEHDARPSPGERDQAAAIAASVLARARELGLRTAACRGLHVLSRLAEGSGDRPRAIALEEEAVALVRAGAAPIDGVLSLHHLGRLLRDERPDDARALLAEAARAVRARLEGLRDDELRRGYLAQAKVREILADDPAPAT